MEIRVVDDVSVFLRRPISIYNVNKKEGIVEFIFQVKGKSKVNIYLGFRNKDAVVLEEEFKKVSDKLLITTDDGSYGISGYAINALKEDIEKENMLVAYYKC